MQNLKKGYLTIYFGLHNLHLHITTIIIFLLLFIRIPFVVGLSAINDYPWINPIYQISTYLLTALFIIVEKDKLSDYHIDRLTIFIIILCKPVQTLLLSYWGFTDLALTFPHWPGLLIWIISFGLLIFTIVHYNNLPKFPLKKSTWIIYGLLLGLISSITFGFFMFFNLKNTQYIDAMHIATEVKRIPITFLYQLGYAAVAEEPVFRGFVWGWLKQRNVKTFQICLIQTALFTLAHFYYIPDASFVLFTVIPLSAALFGWLAYRSKSIIPALLVHAEVNTFTILSASIIFLCRSIMP